MSPETDDLLADVSPEADAILTDVFSCKRALMQYIKRTSFEPDKKYVAARRLKDGSFTRPRLLPRKRTRRGICLTPYVCKLCLPTPPPSGRFSSHPIWVRWPNRRRTHSTLTWFGPRGACWLGPYRSDFTYLHRDMIGKMMFLAFIDSGEARAHFIEGDDDREELAAWLGFDTSQSFCH